MIITRMRLLRRPTDVWPFTLAPIRALADDGVAFRSAITFLVGENGSGKSTLVEALAAAYGADTRGGHIGRRYAVITEKGPLGSALDLEFARGTTMARKPKGFFLRAETAYGVFEFMSNNSVPGYGENHLLHVSHGESFLQVFGARFNEQGLFLLDEPEAALSFFSTLRLMVVLQELAATGAQVVCATHSPILASLPGATILELSDEGITEAAWDELELVRHWRQYLDSPEQYLKHLL